ncbi:hypothetical protein J4E89_006510 [Alternaria sp. Ai002NY15]|nr:hypothetical protein J4E89_006510 [Alternaria sp. Ai002NY15]
MLIEEFNNEESGRMLERLTRRSNGGRVVTERIGGLPLAISQIAALIHQNNWTFEEFVQALDTPRNKDPEDETASLSAKDDLSYCMLINNAGLYYCEIGQFAESQIFTKHAQSIAEAIRTNLKESSVGTEISVSLCDAVLAETFHNLGRISAETNQPDATLVNFSRYNAMLLDQPNGGMQMNENRLAGIFGQSLDYHEKALRQFSRTIGADHHHTGDIHVRIAEHYFRLKDFTVAK